jgi:hypothetical protein
MRVTHGIIKSKVIFHDVMKAITYDWGRKTVASADPMSQVVELKAFG